MSTYYDGYAPADQKRFEQMTKLFDCATTLEQLHEVSLLFVFDMAFDRQDILVALGRAERREGMDVVSAPEVAAASPIVVHNRCTSCRAPLRFEKTPYGSTMPFDAQPELVDGAYEIRADGLAHFVPKDMREGKGPLFVPHFARCTNPDGHRKRKRGK